MKKKAFFNVLISIALILASFLLLAMGTNVQGPNRAPVAGAGMDQVVEPHEMVALDGSGSFDADGDKLTYQWDLIAAPSSGHAKLTVNRGMKTCRLSPDAVGVWMLRLRVYDGRLSGQDVMQIRVQEATPDPSLPPPPQTTVPNLEVTAIRAEGIYQGTFIKNFKVRARTNWGIYGGPLDFRVIGLDSLNGRFSFDKTVTIENVGLTVGEENTWFTLFKNEIEWPEDICQVTFGVVVDPGNKVEEVNEQNNSKERTIYRDSLVAACDARIFPQIIKVGKANLRPVSNGGRFVLPSDTANIFIQFRNCCSINKTMKLAFIYDWTPVTANGENKKVKESTLVFGPGENKALTFSNIKIPKKREFKTLAISREHEKGFDILYTIDVRVDY
jgi:hypothetical protein